MVLVSTSSEFHCKPGARVIYLTTDDWRSPVYRSQVIGTCEYIRDELQAPIRLVAVASPRGLADARRGLRRQFPDATVLPRVRSERDPRWHLLLTRTYFRWQKDTAVIARGVRATALALHLRDRKLVRAVCYDGRGAVAAEGTEYLHPSDQEAIEERLRLEREAVLRSDFRLSVSEQLVKYWHERFGYDGEMHAVIPCALKGWEGDDSTTGPEHRTSIREMLGFGNDDVMLAYAGSLQGWQSMPQVSATLRKWLEERADLRVLFLAREEAAIEDLERAFPHQVRRRRVKPHEVRGFLAAADYGLLIREESKTNAVAAPTKFAEYLAAGLGVLISPGIGDYSDFVIRHECGHIVPSAEFPIGKLENRSDEEREACTKLAQRYFVRSSFRREYERVLQALR